MKGVWLENKSVSIKDNIPNPSLQPDEALVEVYLSGICGTDLQLIEGYYPFHNILGHEFVGVVIQCPNRSDLVGKRVVAEINITCCKYETHGFSRFCI